jgi:tyrosine-specific transport protein
LFITRNAIGADVLGLTVVLGGAELGTSLLAIFVIYVAMLYTGRVLADYVIETSSFDLPSLFRKTLGKPNVIPFCMAYFTLFFCLLVAYWTGLVSIFASVIFPCRECLVIFVIILLFHRFCSIGPLHVLLTGGFIVVFGVLIFLMLQVKSEGLTGVGDCGILSHSLVVSLCSYGFHGAVPCVCR